MALSTSCRSDAFGIATIASPVVSPGRTPSKWPFMVVVVLVARVVARLLLWCHVEGRHSHPARAPRLPAQDGDEWVQSRRQDKAIDGCGCRAQSGREPPPYKERREHRQVRLQQPPEQRRRNGARDPRNPRAKTAAAQRYSYLDVEHPDARAPDTVQLLRRFCRLIPPRV
jgi:hypothetical protein